VALDIPPGERLSRFLFQSNNVRADGTPRHTAFEPPPHGRLSVCVSNLLAEAVLWGICKTHIEPARGKASIGRTDLNSLHVYAESLTVNVDGAPFPQHANIVGWDALRSRQQQMNLASKASAIVKRLP
jgi:hypothetical protein